MNPLEQSNNSSARTNNSFNKIQVTSGSNVLIPKDIRIVLLSEVVEEIRSSDQLKEAVQKIRSTNDEAEKKLEKLKLPYFVAAILKGYRNKESFQSTEVLIFDLDHLKKYDFDTIRKQFEEWEYSSVVFTSPSGDGLKLIIRISMPILSVAEYYDVYEKMLLYLNKKFNVQFDPHTKDPARPCYFSHDEKIFVNSDAEAFDITQLKSEVTSRPASNKREKILSSFAGVQNGERHNALVSQIGLLLNKQIDKDFIKSFTFGSNQLNNPPFTPHEFDKEFSSIYGSLRNYRNEDIVFKEAEFIRGGIKITIDSSKLIDFLIDEGFRKIETSPEDISFVRKVDHVLKNVSIVNIIEYVDNYVSSSNDSDKEEVRDILIKRNSTFFSEGALSFLPSIKPITKHGTKDRSYLFFKNVYLEITSENISVLDYSTFTDKLIWEKSIIPRELDIDCFYNDNHPSEYALMLRNICRNDEAWNEALCCSIGYLAHDHKDKAKAKTIIFCDEEIPTVDDSNGGTGKSLVCEGLKYLRKTANVDGKNFKTDSQFMFQTIELGDEIVIFDDVRKTFDFESLLSAITSDLSIEKKHKGRFTIPFDQSPKFVITTNFTIGGNGNSFDRRKHEIEFSAYYNKTKTPLDEFDHLLFDEWNEKEWTRFYKTMADYIQRYLKHGLKKYELKNLKFRRVIDSTCTEFLDYAQYNVKLNIEYNRKNLLNDFQAQYPEYFQLKPKTFMRWLRIYVNMFDLKIVERKSNADRYIKIVDGLTYQSVRDKQITVEFDDEDLPL